MWDIFKEIMTSDVGSGVFAGGILTLLVIILFRGGRLWEKFNNHEENLKEMKKLVLFFAVAFAMSFASCGNKAAESTEATDSVAVVEEVAVEVVDTVAADSVAVDSAAVVAE